MAETTTNTGTVAGFFENYDNAGQAVEALRDAGFTSAEIGVARRGTASASAPSTHVASSVGSSAEGVWEKVKNFFGAGDDVEPYADEKSRGDLATREITPGSGYNALSGYGADDLHGTMTGLAVPEEHSKYVTHRLSGSETGAVVTVTAGSRAAEAESILRQHGADLGETAASYDYTTPTTAASGNQNLQLLGEVLRVHKDRVSLGEVRLRKEVITETQTVQVPVTREELVIERIAADGTTPVSGTIGENAEIRIPLSEERASIDKSTVVREEVAVGKRTVENVEQLTDAVRHEELVVENETTTTGTIPKTGQTF